MIHKHFAYRTTLSAMTFFMGMMAHEVNAKSNLL